MTIIDVGSVAGGKGGGNFSPQSTLCIAENRTLNVLQFKCL